MMYFSPFFHVQEAETLPDESLSRLSIRTRREHYGACISPVRLFKPLPLQKGKFRALEGQIQVVHPVQDNDSDKELGTLYIILFARRL